MFSKATTLLAFAASASAHMTLFHPTPFSNSTLTRNPLEPADFPCKQRSNMYDITEMNQWNAGETQEVSFAGSAVHGGGSCQFSITTDAEPTKDSQWKVIHSVEGGCPASAPGNFADLQDYASLHKATNFPVTMPEDIPDGRYTFAWTWFNKVGNREFYMNCAPIQVGSASTASTASTAKVAAALGGLPDMFVANLPASSCATAEGQDFVFPNPGQSVARANPAAAYGNATTGGNAACAAMAKLGAGNGKLGSPTGGANPSAPAATQPAYSAAPVPSEAPAYSAAPVPSKAPAYSAAPVASASGIPGVFAPGASPAPAATAPAYSAAPVASAAPVTPSTPHTTDCTPCTNDGAVVCIGSDSFGLCNRGCAVAQKLSLGTMCRDGKVIGATKRSFPRAHLHKRHGAGLRSL